MRHLIPSTLEIDLWEDQAWVGVVPFRMERIRRRGMPAVPVLSATPEINVRTYVIGPGGKPGVWFFSLDAASSLVVWGARRFFGLPYFPAAMECHVEDGEVRYRSSRTGSRAEFRARYRPTGPVQLSRLGTLDHWLTERYCLYTAETRADILHPQWPLQPAEADIDLNTMADAAGIWLPDTAPLLHFARRLDVKVWAPVHLLS